MLWLQTHRGKGGRRLVSLAERSGPSISLIAGRYSHTSQQVVCEERTRKQRKGTELKPHQTDLINNSSLSYFEIPVNFKLKEATERAKQQQ